MNDFAEHLRRGTELGREYRLAPGSGARRGGEFADAGRRAGESLEFIEHREYRPGDDLRHLDWNVFARTDQLTVKRFREERTPELELLLDTSRSMDLPETGKAAAAWGYAALTAAAAEAGGFGVRLWSLAETSELLAKHGPARWRETPFAGCAVTRDAATAFGGAAHPGSARILISDLLFPESPETILPSLARGAGGAAVLQLATAEELSPSPGRRLLYEVETGTAEELHLTPEVLRRYCENLRAHFGRWERACAGMGIGFVRLTADSLEVEPLLRGGVLF